MANVECWLKIFVDTGCTLLGENKQFGGGGEGERVSKLANMCTLAPIASNVNSCWMGVVSYERGKRRSKIELNQQTKNFHQSMSSKGTVHSKLLACTLT